MPFSEPVCHKCGEFLPAPGARCPFCAAYQPIQLIEIKTTPKPCGICGEMWFAETFDKTVDGEVVCDDCLNSDKAKHCDGCSYLFRPGELKNIASTQHPELYCDECLTPEDETEW